MNLGQNLRRRKNESPLYRGAILAPARLYLVGVHSNGASQTLSVGRGRPAKQATGECFGQGVGDVLLGALQLVGQAPGGMRVSIVIDRPGARRDPPEAFLCYQSPETDQRRFAVPEIRVGLARRMCRKAASGASEGPH